MTTFKMIKFVKITTGRISDNHRPVYYTPVKKVYFPRVWYWSKSGVWEWSCNANQYLATLKTAVEFNIHKMTKFSGVRLYFVHNCISWVYAQNLQPTTIPKAEPWKKVLAYVSGLRSESRDLAFCPDGRAMVLSIFQELISGSQAKSWVKNTDVDH